MRKLEQMTRHCKANPTYYGLTGTAFACCLADLHIRIQHAIWTVLKSAQPMTVMTIFHSLGSIMEVIGRFSKFIHLDGSIPQQNTLSASAIEHLCKFGFYIPFGKDILEALRTELLLRWLGLSGRKMITDADFEYWSDVVDESPLRDPYANYNTRSFMERYRPKGTRHLPYFLDSRQAKMIVRTGCALQLLREFQPDHPLCTLEAADLGLRWIITEAQSREYGSCISDV
ncbi:hypothetical protein BX666DRAFT_582187 [Dichotomocladium elegans]|nr:hypothetical protein BX666DRAFT_582187 [Dichotomocladium elegans]